VDNKRLVHGMLTEYVRTEGYELGMDHEITPSKRHFHLMVPPLKPLPSQGKFKHDAVKTGFQMRLKPVFNCPMARCCHSGMSCLKICKWKRCASKCDRLMRQSTMKFS
jgi:hypothetical protein